MNYSINTLQDLIELLSNHNATFDANMTVPISIFNLKSDDDYRQQRYERALKVVSAYSLLIVLSLTGNLLVCMVIIGRREMRSRCNLIILNLTISDLLMTLFNIPFNLVRLLSEKWPFGLVLCKLIPFVQITTVYVSSFSMSIIAIDRYQAITRPFSSRMSTRWSTGCVIAGIWLLAGCFAAPHAYFVQIARIQTFRLYTKCRGVYPQPEFLYRQALTLLAVPSQYLLPLSVAAFAYFRIGQQIWRRQQVGEATESQSRSHAASKWKTMRIVVLVVGIFTVCWLPLNLYHIRVDFGGDYWYDDQLFIICHWIAMSSVCYNPIVYFWLNKEFRRSAQKLLPCWRTPAASAAARSGQNTITMELAVNGNREPKSGSTRGSPVNAEAV